MRWKAGYKPRTISFGAWIAEQKEAAEMRTLDRADKMKGVFPLHPDLAGRIIGEFLHKELDDDYLLCLDVFTASSFVTDWCKIKYTARVLDSAEPISFGHGIGHALGAGMATDRKIPIFSIIGDGCIGTMGMDIETCARWDIPAVFIHENNDAMPTNIWRPWFRKSCAVTDIAMRDSNEKLPWIRYDRMMAEFGCHTEFVMRDPELRPALKRATDWVKNKCKPAFIEVHTNPEVNNEIMAIFSSLIYGFLKWDEIAPEGQRYALTQGMAEEPYLSIGADPSWKEVIEKYKRGELPLPELPEEPLYPEVDLPHDGVRF